MGNFILNKKHMKLTLATAAILGYASAKTAAKNIHNRNLEQAK